MAELKDVLHLAADADQRKDALLEELRVGARDAKERVERERAELARDREIFDKERREQREAELLARARAEESEYQRREMQARVENMTGKLAERGAQNESMAREHEAARKHLRECQMELETLKETAQSVETLLRKEVEEMRAEIEDLAEIVKVKDRMLDDQNVAIQQAKAQVKAKEEELLTQTEKQNKYYSKYEDKVAQANEEAERQR